MPGVFELKMLKSGRVIPVTHGGAASTTGTHTPDPSPAFDQIPGLGTRERGPCSGAENGDGRSSERPSEPSFSILY